MDHKVSLSKKSIRNKEIAVSEVSSDITTAISTNICLEKNFQKKQYKVNKDYIKKCLKLEPYTHYSYGKIKGNYRLNTEKLINFILTDEEKEYAFVEIKTKY